MRIKFSFSALLICLVTLLVFPNFLDFEEKRLVTLFILNAIMLLSLVMVKEKQWELWFGSIIAAFAIVISSLNYLNHDSRLELGALILNVIFYSFLVIELLRFIINSKQVDKNILSASACVYMLFGVIWCFIYATLDHFQPDSILSSSGHLIFDDLSKYLYFSFVTLTTLGYGDISPSTKLAQSWVILQAVIGQLYLALIVARLVGLYKVPQER
jgi:voltage-gated potassium channel